MEKRGVHRGGEKGQTRCALCVMSCLLVVIGIMLPYVLSPSRPGRGPHIDIFENPLDTEPSADASEESSSSKPTDDGLQDATYTESEKTTSHTEAEMDDESKNESGPPDAKYSESETTVSHDTEASHDDSNESSSSSNSDSSDIPSDEDKVRVVPVNHNWTSLLGDGCGDDGCSWSCGHGQCLLSGSGWISGLMLTPDGRLVMTNWHSKSVVVVKPPSAHTTVELPEQPLGLALIGKSSGHVAVTCGLKVILLINIDETDQPIQRIPTKKRYAAVTSGLTDTTLIVSSLADGDDDVSIDVITLQGDVIKTLMDATHLEILRHSFSLTNMYGDVLVCAMNKQRHTSVLLRLSQSKSPSSQLDLSESRSSQSDQSDQSQWDAEEYKDEQLSGHMWKTVVHPAGHIFISQDDGVLLRTTDGQYLRVLDQPDPFLNPTAMALAGDTLFVIWDHARFADFVLVEYRLLGLPFRPKAQLNRIF